MKQLRTDVDTLSGKQVTTETMVVELQQQMTQLTAQVQNAQETGDTALAEAKAAKAIGSANMAAISGGDVEGGKPGLEQRVGNIERQGATKSFVTETVDEAKRKFNDEIKDLATKNDLSTSVFWLGGAIAAMFFVFGVGIITAMGKFSMKPSTESTVG